MSTPNEQDEAFVMLPDLALGNLPKAEAERLMAIVRTSPKLQAELASLRGTVDVLGYAVPKAQLSYERRTGIRSRLMSRAAADANLRIHDETGERAAVPTPMSSPAIRESRGTPLATPALSLDRQAGGDTARPTRSTPVVAQKVMPKWVPMLLAAAGIAVVASVWKAGSAVADLNAAQKAYAAATAEASRLGATLAVRDSMIASLTGPKVTVVEMVSTAKLPPGARMFWDRIENRWTLVTHDLPKASEGHVYQLWLVTAKSEKISAGTFNTDASGNTVFQATYALAGPDLAAIAITEEPEGGSPQPTGGILIAGTPTR
ncbi:MAG: anti-sigma factor [Gemmatimonadaceae bacterium]|nr:anti-sigma factor [Gemmatimonadaceae bacterium]